MKTIIRTFCLLTILFFTGWLNAGCNQGISTNEEASPQGTCRIQQYNATSTSRFANTTGQTLYTYDIQGNLTKKMTTWRKEPINGTPSSQTSTTTDTYTYDADGYLTGSTEQILTITVLDGKTKEEQYSKSSNYTYTNGRLSTRIDKTTGTYASQNGTTTTTYDYDATGSLTTMTAGSDKLMYQNNQLTAITSSGISYTIQNGVVTKMVIPGDSEFIGTGLFDDQHRLVKHDEYINGQLNRSSNWTWNNVKPASVSLPVFKGFPATVPTSPFSGQESVPATYKQLHWNSVSKIMQPFNEDTYTVQTNEQGFITGATIVSKHPLAADQDYVTTEVYTYTGCQ